MKCLLLAFAMWLLAFSLACVGIAYGGDLPDHKLTPGIATNATSKEVCTKGYVHANKLRRVTTATKRRVHEQYGLRANARPCPCEVDHLISLELGGSNDPRNLWPEPYTTRPWNAHVKDRLEARLRAQVCHGNMPLKTAQRALADNWIAEYKRQFSRAAARLLKGAN